MMLPIFIPWAIWIMRNKSIFESIIPNVNQCSIQSISLFKEFSSKSQLKKQKLLYKPIPVSFSVLGFFDGSSADGCWGSGLSVKINENHYFKLWMGGDKGSNTKVELLGLWGVLFVCQQMWNWISRYICWFEGDNRVGKRKFLLTSSSVKFMVHKGQRFDQNLQPYLSYGHFKDFVMSLPKNTLNVDHVKHLGAKKNWIN